MACTSISGGFHLRDNIDAFIHDTLYIDDTGALRRYFIDFMKPYGFDFLSYHYIADSFKRVSQDRGFRIAEFPQAWIDHYIECDYFEIDPTVEETRQRGFPFRFSDILARDDLTPEQKVFLADLHEIGFRDGIAIPVFARPGDIAHFILGSSKEDLEFTPGDLLELQALCQHMHVRYNEISKKIVTPKLSPRETQVLELIAQGKSNAAIGKLLGVSPNTIDTLVRRCFEKLGVTTRVEAALAGVGQGLILP